MDSGCFFTVGVGNLRNLLFTGGSLISLNILELFHVYFEQ